MLRSPKGYSLVESVTALSLLLLILTSFLPLLLYVKQQERLLSDRRLIQSELHDELLYFIHHSSKPLPASYERIIQKRSVTFSITKERDYMKGCVEWDNVNQNTETFCLYGKEDEPKWIHPSRKSP
ncbi:hypothetical protein FN924_10595 [Radiobacillus deserti]|uniref:Type II secretion system protein n=1 Tax=Radiobacillus deserti TaxID=2594883 RepID=A0A516KGU2_9BACI|nr:hypothetical protein FN924_10595 [Radiobacillus deserti]